MFKHIKEREEIFLISKRKSVGRKVHGASIILWCCFSAAGTGALHKIDGIMKKERYLNIKATSQDISQEAKT